MTAYVAAGRLIGYYETHLKSWDCLAGLVLVREAGGGITIFCVAMGCSVAIPAWSPRRVSTSSWRL